MLSSKFLPYLLFWTRCPTTGVYDSFPLCILHPFVPVHSGQPPQAGPTSSCHGQLDNSKDAFWVPACLEGFSWVGLAVGQILERRIKMSASVKWEFLSTCILVGGFMLSKITEWTNFNMRNPSNLPGDMQGAQMNDCKKLYLEKQKRSP